MATHYTATNSSAITATDYHYDGSMWTKITLNISIAANGTVTYTAKAEHKGGVWSNTGLWITVNGNTIGNNYYNADSECIGTGKFPKYNGSTYSGSGGTVTGGSVSYEIKLDCGSDGNVHGWTGGAKGNYKGTTISGSVTRNYWTDGTAPTCGISQTAGNNTITFSGKLGNSGTNNAMSSATLYYWMNGATSYASQALTATSGGDWKVTKTANQDDEVYAYVTCAYPHGNKSCTAVSRNCYYYTAGGTPTCFISQSKGSNTVTISGSRGANGNHNGKTASKLYYNLGKGGGNVEVNLGTTGSDSYTYTLTMDSSNNNKIISAFVTTTYTYGGSKTGYATSITSKYFSKISSGTVTITDHGNNTFTITGYKGNDGNNNSVTNSWLEWTVHNAEGNWWTDTNGKFKSEYFKGNSLVKANLKLSDYGVNTVATRQVAAKVASYSEIDDWVYPSNYTFVNIPQYVAPGSPGNPALAASSLKNGRLTIKKNWTFTWTEAQAGNTSSPVKGYRIRVYKNDTLITGITAGTNSNISKGTGTDAWLDRTGATNCSITFNPETFGFKPGDKVKVGVFAWATNGAGSVLWSGNGSTQAISEVYTVENAGVMRIKVGGSWKEGQVWIKTGGAWKEAVSVHAKVGGSWKEST